MKTTRIHLIRVKLGLAVVLVAVALNSTGNFQPTRAASSSGATAATQDISVSDSSTARGETEDVIGTLADGYIAIVNSTFLTDQAVEWNPRHLEIAKQVFEDAVMNSDHGYVSRRKGFGSLSRWAQAMGITPAPEECLTGCQFAGGAIRLA